MDAGCTALGVQNRDLGELQVKAAYAREKAWMSGYDYFFDGIRHRGKERESWKGQRTGRDGWKARMFAGCKKRTVHMQSSQVRHDGSDKPEEDEEIAQRLRVRRERNLCQVMIAQLPDSGKAQRHQRLSEKKRKRRLGIGAGSCHSGAFGGLVKHCDHA